MKRPIILLTLLLAALCGTPLRAAAQSRELEALFVTYGGDDRVRSAFFERTMMRMMSRQAAERGDGELARLLDELQFIRVLHASDYPEPIRRAEALVRADKRFRLITETHLDGESARVYLCETRRKAEKELVVITENAEQTIVHLYGSFDLKDVSRITTLRSK